VFVQCAIETQGKILQQSFEQSHSEKSATSGGLAWLDQIIIS